jgi:hypothetical protein
MSLVQHFEFKSTDENALDLLPWIETLSAEEQQEFFEARARQLGNRQKAIDAGHLVVDMEADTYTWTDETALEGKNHGADTIWQSYFERWLKETNHEMITTFTEE